MLHGPDDKSMARSGLCLVETVHQTVHCCRPAALMLAT